MVVAKFCTLPRLPRLRRLVCGLAAAGCTLLLLGGLDRFAPRALANPPSAPVAVVRRVDRGPLPVEIGATRGEPAQGKVLVVDVDAVLRLVDEHNAEVALAREKLRESQIQLEYKSCMARMCGCVGNIQCLACEPRYWQRRIELAKVTHEARVEAAGAYIDLVTARRGETISRKLEEYCTDLLRRAEDTYKRDASVAVLVENVRTEVSRRKQAFAQLRSQGDAAAAKLVYLLGQSPETILQPAETMPMPIALVDATQETSELVNRAMTNGPGIPELEGLIGAAQRARELLNHPLKVLLIHTMSKLCCAQLDCAADSGTQGCCPQGGIQKMRCIADSKLQQLDFSLQDLRGKLAAGAKESRETIIGSQEQFTHATEQMRHASEAYKLSDLRLKETVPGSSIGEVLLSIVNLERAHFSYLNAVSAHNKAQVRLMLLLGPVAVQGK